MLSHPARPEPPAHADLSRDSSPRCAMADFETIVPARRTPARARSGGRCTSSTTITKSPTSILSYRANSPTAWPVSFMGPAA